MSELIATGLPWPGLAAQWLVSDRVGARFGSALLLTVPPQHGYVPHRHMATERVIYVVKGAGLHLGSSTKTLRIEADDVLEIPPGSWHGFQNTESAETTILMLFSPATSFPFDDYYPADGVWDTETRLTCKKLHTVIAPSGLATSENGFERFRAGWEEHQGVKTIMIGFAEFDGNSTHRWHRHTKADEGSLVLSGRGHSCHDSIVPPGVTPGDNVVTSGNRIWHPAGVWHTLKMDEGDRMNSVWFYLGAGSLQESGYELREKASAHSNGGEIRS